MQLIKKINQTRRDFTGVYECQNCKNIEKKEGYDDNYFHDEVIPDMKCSKCGQSTNSLKLKNERIATKYRDYEIV